MNNTLEEAKEIFGNELDQLAITKNGGGEADIYVEITLHTPNVSRKSEFAVIAKKGEEQ